MLDIIGGLLDAGAGLVNRLAVAAESQYDPASGGIGARNDGGIGRIGDQLGANIGAGGVIGGVGAQRGTERRFLHGHDGAIGDGAVGQLVGFEGFSRGELRLDGGAISILPPHGACLLDIVLIDGRCIGDLGGQGNRWSGRGRRWRRWRWRRCIRGATGQHGKAKGDQAGAKALG